MKTEALVTAFGRANFGLIALNAAMEQIDGSFGLALNIPAVTVEVKQANEFYVLPETYRDICDGIVERLGIERDFGIEISVSINAHCGLAVAKALILFKDLAVKDDELLAVVRRGGTSNLGYYSFLRGGFIVESGHRFGKEKDRTGPGHEFVCRNKTPLVYRGDFPDWGICLITPKKYLNVSGELESRLFEEFCPVPEDEINALCRYILMGVIPAVQTSDFDLFCSSLEKSMQVGFRSREFRFRENETEENVDLLRKVGFKGIGMTSFGPTVFGFARSRNEAKMMALSLQSDENRTVTITTARNRGADFKVE